MSSVFTFTADNGTELADTTYVDYTVDFNDPGRRRRRGRRARGRRAGRGKTGCFTNPRTGVRMRALGGRRGFARCR